MKKGQITVFIIIGIIILFVIGTVLYLSRTGVIREIEAGRPRVTDIPQQIQPLRDLVESCIERVGTDGLRRIGDSGGYVNYDLLQYNPVNPTDGNALQFSPGQGPPIAYWWHMKSPNSCEQNCEFKTERPTLNEIEMQLGRYVTENLQGCLGRFEGYQPCQVQELGNPEVTATMGDQDVFFIGDYPLRALCVDQTFDVEDYQVSIPLNFKEIYEVATELAKYQQDETILEQATKIVLESFSAADSNKLPPFREFAIGPPRPGVFWIKMEVLDKIQSLLTTYIPLIQPSGVRNYNYIGAPAGVRDPQLYEFTFNQQFFLPLSEGHPTLEARFYYLDWWEPYFDLNCNGQICQADSASNFFLLPFTMNRYEFAYDLSYPVVAEVRDPGAMNGEGYSFKIALEQNLRNSEAFTSEYKPITAYRPDKPPSIFCNPEQQTSGEITIKAIDGKTLDGSEDATVSFICRDEVCNMGEVENGELTSKFPRCVGGTLRLIKTGYATYSSRLDTNGEEPLEVEVMLEPLRVLKATVRNYEISKQTKRGQWSFPGGSALPPKKDQETTIQLIREGDEYEEPYTAVVQLYGKEPGEISLIPGKYKVVMTSLLRGGPEVENGEPQLVIPKDYRCTRGYRKWPLGKKKRTCFFIPPEPMVFNYTSPYPYGNSEFDFTIRSSALRGASKIVFKQFVQAIDQVPKEDRVIEDLNAMESTQLFTSANKNRVKPVIT